MSQVMLVLDKNCKPSNSQYQMLPADLKSKIETCHINGSDNEVIMGEVVKPCKTDIVDTVKHTPAWSVDGNISYGFMTVGDLDAKL